MTFGWAQLSAVGVVVDWDRHRTPKHQAQNSSQQRTSIWVGQHQD
jgi:hypothetical protein